MIWSRQRKLERETLIRIAGTPTIRSSNEAKTMAKMANDVLTKNKKEKNKNSGRLKLLKGGRGKKNAPPSASPGS